LLKSVRDKNFERLVKLCNGGKVTHYVNAINNRHHSAAQIHNSNINKTSTITWTVKSESLEEEYLVKKCEPCACKVICVACKICVHLFSCTCYDYTIKNNMCKHIHAVKMNTNDDHEDQIDVQTCTNNPMETDEICMKMSSVQQITVPSTESIANKMQQLYSMFVSQGGKLNNEQLNKINLSLDTNLKILYEQESNAAISLNENREPANKNVEKQLRFFSTKKLRLKIPEEQRLNKPTLNVKQQIIDDLNGKEESPYVHMDPHFDHSYEQ